MQPPKRASTPAGFRFDQLGEDEKQQALEEAAELTHFWIEWEELQQVAINSLGAMNLDLEVKNWSDVDPRYGRYVELEGMLYLNDLRNLHNVEDLPYLDPDELARDAPLIHHLTLWDEDIAITIRTGSAGANVEVEEIDRLNDFLEEMLEEYDLHQHARTDELLDALQQELDREHKALKGLLTGFFEELSGTLWQLLSQEVEYLTGKEALLESPAILDSLFDEDGHRLGWSDEVS